MCRRRLIRDLEGQSCCRPTEILYTHRAQLGGRYLLLNMLVCCGVAAAFNCNNRTFFNQKNKTKKKGKENQAEQNRIEQRLCCVWRHDGGGLTRYMLHVVVKCHHLGNIHGWMRVVYGTYGNTKL